MEIFFTLKFSFRTTKWILFIIW